MILAKNLSLSYDNKKNIIEEANFKIEKKEFIILTGPSGSGKSTLLKSFYGDIPVKNGDLYVTDYSLTNIDSTDLNELRKDIGIIFQDYKLIKSYTILENIMVPLLINGHTKEVSFKQANLLLNHVKLIHKENCFPHELSGGEQQRIAVARALSHNPKIIFADEPTGNLDEYSAEVIWTLLRRANQEIGITIFAVTHRIPKHLGINYRQLSIDQGVIYEIS